MSLAIRLTIIAFTFFTFFILNVAYRTYFIPEIVSGVAQQQMDRANGDTPAILLRTHNQIRNAATFISIALVGAITFLLLLPEINKSLKNSTETVSISTPTAPVEGETES